MNNKAITFLGCTFRPESFETVSLGDALENIRAGKFNGAVDRVRRIYETEGKSNAYDTAKKSLPSYAFGGTFDGKVDNAHLAKHSMLLHFDLDHIDVDATRKALAADEHVLFLFVSPSGDGLKGGIPISGSVQSDADHKRAFAQVARYMREHHGVEIDPACKDVRRLCFVSYDPDLYHNPDAKPFQVADAPPPPPPPKKPMGRATIAHIPDRLIRRKLEAACQKIIDAPKGEMHHARLRIARLVGGWIAGGIIGHETARNALETAVIASEVKDFKASMKTIDDGLKYGAEKPISAHELIDEYQNYMDRKQRERQAVQAFNDWKRRYKRKLCQALDRGSMGERGTRHLKIMLNGSESDRLKVYREVSKNER